VRQDLLYFLSHLKNVRVMKCSNCGAVIAKIEEGMFDISNCSWKIEGDVITPYR